MRSKSLERKPSATLLFTDRISVSLSDLKNPYVTKSRKILRNVYRLKLMNVAFALELFWRNVLYFWQTASKLNKEARSETLRAVIKTVSADLGSSKHLGQELKLLTSDHSCGFSSNVQELLDIMDCLLIPLLDILWIVLPLHHQAFVCFSELVPNMLIDIAQGHPQLLIEIFIAPINKKNKNVYKVTYFPESKLLYINS